MGKSSKLETDFMTLWSRYAPDHVPPVREYYFAKPRRFRFDMAWPDKKVAVELEGGVYTGGRHTRGSGYENDCLKYNLAVLKGWRVLRFTRNLLRTAPADSIMHIVILLNR